MAIVTVSAAYGAGGALVGPKLAERLGVPFLDRALPTEVAERLAIPLDEAMARDESIGGVLSRMAMRLAPIGLAFGAETAPDVVDEEAYRRTTEELIREHAANGDLVVLGRAAALVLHDDPRSLHVRLDGPRDRRIEQAVRLGDGERAEVEKRLDETDRAREAYVRHFYRADPRDPHLYHLTIDSTAIPLEAVVEMIELAALSRTR
jgi:cytidylate kinase